LMQSDGQVKCKIEISSYWQRCKVCYKHTHNYLQGFMRIRKLCPSSRWLAKRLLGTKTNVSLLRTEIFPSKSLYPSYRRQKTTIRKKQRTWYSISQCFKIYVF
jgi:hypothetical protein